MNAAGPRSRAGRALVSKCRQLRAENDFLGRQVDAARRGEVLRLGRHDDAGGGVGGGGGGGGVGVGGGGGVGGGEGGDAFDADSLVDMIVDEGAGAGSAAAGAAGGPDGMTPAQRAARTEWELGAVRAYLADVAAAHNELEREVEVLREENAELRLRLLGRLLSK